MQLPPEVVAPDAVVLAVAEGETTPAASQVFGAPGLAFPLFQVPPALLERQTVSDAVNISDDVAGLAVPQAALQEPTVEAAAGSQVLEAEAVPCPLGLGAA